MNVPKGALFAAYVTAMGWVAYHDMFQLHQPPQPRTIVKGSALYGLLGLAAPLITDQLAATLGWGLLIAIVIRDQGSPPAVAGGPEGGGGADADFGDLPGSGVPDAGTRPTPAPGGGSRGRVKAIDWLPIPSNGIYRRNGVTIST